MSAPFQINVYDNQRLVFESGELSCPVELGRQMQGEDKPYSLKQEPGRWRLVMANVEEDTVSRKHVLVEPLGENQFRLTNLRDKLTLRLEGNHELKPLASCECSLPYVLTLGSKAVRLLQKGTNGFEVQSLGESARPPGTLARDPSLFSARATLPTPATEREAVFYWLHAIMEVLQSAATSSDFFQQAVKAAVDLVRLDSCRVLLIDHDEWKTQAVETRLALEAEASWDPSRTILAKVRQEKKTCWQVPRQANQAAHSLMGVRAVVAAPILDRRGEVIGVLYGDRLVGSNSVSMPQITKLEAMLVELLASGIAAGLARLEQEKAALTARVQFEQFFTPELSRQLALNPDMLKGQDAEVTILFCDLRGFSRLSERLGPDLTVQWISDVMGALSDCVHAHQGVLVNYIGDELMAMWGAPEQQEAPAALACRAALQMLDVVPKLNERWQARLQEPMALGIGINTGIARVGNIGSHRKFTYGPLGNTVNVASRVQGASKFLKTSLLVTGSTRAQLDASFAVRRLGKVRVVNIAEPVDLYELVPPGEPLWAMEAYEKALEDFEQKNFLSAVRILGSLVVEFPGDGPSRVLLSRAVTFLDGEAGDFVPVWELPGK